jgi:hypothetical protein
MVLYGPQGSVIRSFALEEFLPEHYVRVLPVSAPHWWGTARLSSDGRSVVIPVFVPVGPCGHGGAAGFVDFTLRFGDGALVPPPAAEWAAALAAAARYPSVVNRAECRREAEAH